MSFLHTRVHWRAGDDRPSSAFPEVKVGGLGKRQGLRPLAIPTVTAFARALHA